MRKVLYVGFKGKNNSSHKLVESLKGEKCFLTNSFNGLKKDIDNVNDKYDIVYMFGLDKTLKDVIKIEKYAELNNHIVRSTVDLSNIIQKFDEYDVKYIISRQPTYYLCNEAYYHMLFKMKSQAVFFHIPALKYLSEDLHQRLLNVFNGHTDSNLSCCETF